MKTSLLISSFAALGLLITFAGAPRRHGKDKMNLASTDNIAIVTVNTVTMLPGVVITPVRNNKTGIAVPSHPAEDLSYLKFDGNVLMEADDNNLKESEVLPEASETDISYLKFETDKYISTTEIGELPIQEVNTINQVVIIIPGETPIDFSYLKFDGNKYYSPNNLGYVEQFELPEE